MKVRPLAVAHLLVASTLTASCLLTVALLRTASSAQVGMKDCCIGKPGHEAGSCSSGLASTHDVADDDAEAVSETTSSSVMAVGGGAEGRSNKLLDSSQAEQSKRHSINVVTRECGGECGTCSTSLSRQPRPRQYSTLADNPRLHLLNCLLSVDLEFPGCNALRKTASQLRPRGPPTHST